MNNMLLQINMPLLHNTQTNTCPQLMEIHMIIHTEPPFLEMLANQALTVTMANAVPNGDTVELVIESLFLGADYCGESTSSYGAPVYNTPVYSTPAYNQPPAYTPSYTPSYSTPVYKAPTYTTPSYNN